jgi:hypothetical protein
LWSTIGTPRYEISTPRLLASGPNWLRPSLIAFRDFAFELGHSSGGCSPHDDEPPRSLTSLLVRDTSPDGGSDQATGERPEADRCGSSVLGPRFSARARSLSTSTETLGPSKRGILGGVPGPGLLEKFQCRPLLGTV